MKDRKIHVIVRGEMPGSRTKGIRFMPMAGRAGASKRGQLVVSLHFLYSGASTHQARIGFGVPFTRK
jgi:hypothetical protein